MLMPHRYRNHVGTINFIYWERGLFFGGKLLVDFVGLRNIVSIFDDIGPEKSMPYGFTARALAPM